MAGARRTRLEASGDERVGDGVLTVDVAGEAALDDGWVDRERLALVEEVARLCTPCGTAAKAPPTVEPAPTRLGRSAVAALAPPPGEGSPASAL
jgi:hypothetical protein